MSASDLVARLAQEGIDPTLLSEVAEALFTGEIEARKLEERRSNDRNRKRDQRSRDVTGQDVTSEDVTDKGSPEVSPQTPLPNPSKTAPLSPPKSKGVDVPDWMPLPEWGAFKEMRRKMRSVPFTETAERTVIARIAKLKADGHDPAKLLLKAVERGHRTVFEDESTKVGPAKREPTAQELRERAEWFIKHGRPDDAEECRRKAIALEQRRAA